MILNLDLTDDQYKALIDALQERLDLLGGVLEMPSTEFNFEPGELNTLQHDHLATMNVLLMVKSSHE